MHKHFDSLWTRPRVKEKEHFDKFLFDTSFDRLPCEHVEQEAFFQPEMLKPVVVDPPKPLFTEEEKKQAYEEGLQQGHGEGYQQGVEETKNAIEFSAQQHLQKIEQFLEQAVSHLEEQKKALTYQAIVLTRQIFQTLFPLLEQKWGAEQVQKMVETIINSEKPGALKVIVHPRLKEFLEKRFEKSSKILKLTWETDPQFSLSDCQIFWDQSGVERRVSKMTQEIEDLFKGFESVLQESKNTSSER